MPDQDIATQWKSFDDARRSRLLQKMSPDQKRNLRRVIEGSGPHSLSDFTSNPTGEGLYRMLPAAQRGYTDVAQEIEVPFSRIKNAQTAGYNLHPDEKARYAKDVRYKGQGPTWYEQVDQHIQQALTPEIPSAPKTVVDLTPANAAFRNQLRAAGRVVYTMPGYVKQLANAVVESHRTGNANQVLDLIDPAQIPKGLLEQYRQDRKTSPALAVQNLIGSIVGIGMTGKVMGEAAEVPGKSLSALRAEAERRFAPRNVEVAGVNIPVAIGEAEPESAAGRLQTNLKRRGVGAAKFTKLENAQQARIREVIRRTAQQTSELVGPMQDEPGAAMQDAATATFQQAKPAFEALDQSLQTVPVNFKNVSKIVQQAMARAGKLGVNVGGEGPVDLSKITPEQDGTIQWGGTRISKATHPERWAQLVQDGIISDTGQGTPLSAAMRVRSELLKMQRGTADAALRNTIGNEVRTIDAAMDTALAGTALHDNWIEARRLWSKAYALRSVADEIRATVKGTPAAAQAPGLAPVPTRPRGASPVARLNKLAERGTLERAFTHEEIANLRQSADILDRAQRTPIGKSGGGGVLHSRGLTHALAGATVPAIGAGVGFAVGGLRGATEGATLAFLAQQFGEHALVRIMARADGVEALKAMEAAKTPAQAQVAMRTLASVAAGASAAQKPTRTLRQLKAEAAMRKPAATGQNAGAAAAP